MDVNICPVRIEGNSMYTLIYQGIHTFRAEVRGRATSVIFGLQDGGPEYVFLVIF